MSKENYIEEIRPHDSAYKHVSGYAEYTDDINEPKNTIYGAIGLSKKAHAIIKKIDLTEVKKSEGVISVVTQRDIPCLLYTSPSPRDISGSRMPSSA